VIPALLKRNIHTGKINKLTGNSYSSIFCILMIIGC